MKKAYLNPVTEIENTQLEPFMVMSVLVDDADKLQLEEEQGDAGTGLSRRHNVWED